MTSEIACLNSEAVALAADSAVTIGDGGKIFQTANKIFALSEFHPVGIMIYDSADFMGLPWETVIKEARKALGTKENSTIQEYVKFFLDFLRYDLNNSLSPDAEIIHINTQTKNVVDSLLGDLQIWLDERAGQETDEEEIEAWVGKWTSDRLSEWQTLQERQIKKRAFNGILKNRGSQIESILKSSLEKTPIAPTDFQNLVTLSVLVLTCSQNIPVPGLSGVVIAGFGKDQLRPELVELKVGGMIDQHIRYHVQQTVKIDDGNGATIVPFAQSEMVHAFITGIEPSLEQDYDGAIHKVAKDIPVLIAKRAGITGNDLDDIAKEAETSGAKAAEGITNALKKRRKEKFTDSVVNVVQHLPKDELAALSEALVDLTKIKRRVSQDKETVGGPIDVAVISKGDGLIWIKRKHYFDASLNPHFFWNRGGMQ